MENRECAFCRNTHPAKDFYIDKNHFVDVGVNCLTQLNLLRKLIQYKEEGKITQQLFELERETIFKKVNKKN